MNKKTTNLIAGVLGLLLFSTPLLCAETYTNVSVTTSATLVAAPNSSRQTLAVMNNSSSATLYLGFDTAVSTTTGMAIPPNTGYEFSEHKERYTGAIYGIATTGTIDVRKWEWNR